MKKYLLLLIIFSATLIKAQDIGVINISSPASGCSLSVNSNVVVQIFNFGPAINTNIDVSYRINGGAPVTETIIIFSSFLSSSVYSYTFSTKANLSAPGTYIIDAYTSYPGDTDRSNDSLLNYTVISEVQQAGSVSGSTFVCAGSNSGALTLAGYAGSILQWEYSTDNGASWNSVSNTQNTLNYNSLTVETKYRALTKTTYCPSIYSDTATISVDSPSVGGIVNGSTTACPSSSGTLTLTGYTGSIVSWQSSTNSGASWGTITNTSASQNYSGLTDTTWYRVEIKNGTCPPAFSSIAIIAVLPASAGGTIAGSTTVCSGSNSGALTLSGYTGNILNWQFSTDGGTTWNNIANTNPANNFSNLTGTTLYRAEVLSCAPSAYSTPATVSVDAPSLGGSVSGDTTVCKGSSGNLNLAGYTGNILNWEFSEDTAVSWNNISNTSASNGYNTLMTTTLYRAVVKNGTCPSVASDPAIISVFPRVLNAGSDVVIDLGKSIILNAQGGSTYSWSPVSGLSNSTGPNPVAFPLVTTIYFVTALDIFGCLDQDTIEVTVIGNYDFIVNNLITPNGDNINDEWFIENIEKYPAAEVFIYTSSGTEVYHAAPYLNDWKGTYKGQKLPDGTYYYVIKFSDNEKVFKGHITIVDSK